jgi:DNA-binding protein H-NS
MKSGKDNIPNIDSLTVGELTELIDRAEKLRADKMDEARATFLAEMKAKAAELGIELDPRVARSGRRKRSDAGVRLKPKYVGPNGETYSGRGPTPRWLKDLEAKGQSRDRYLA